MVMVYFLIFAALVTVSQCRVTFTHSEVLQQSDLDDANRTSFKCDNGCLIYSDSSTEDMFVSDGFGDIINFFIMGDPDNGTTTELVPSDNYTLEYRGSGEPPRFVFYAVDKQAPFLDTPVYAVTDEVEFHIDSSTTRRFTLLNSDDRAPDITFNGELMAGYPRIYTTGYDATSERECTPVYQGRSQQSAINSLLNIPSPMITVDLGLSAAAAVIHHKGSNRRRQKRFADWKPSNSSVVYISAGYVGCSNVQGQLYYPYTDSIVKAFSAKGDSLDMEATVTWPSKVDTTQFGIFVNYQEVDLFGTSPIKRHWESTIPYFQFDVSLVWNRPWWLGLEDVPTFAVQFDFGLYFFDESTTTSTTKSTTTSTKPKDGNITTTPGVETTTSTTTSKIRASTTPEFEDAKTTSSVRDVLALYSIVSSLLIVLM